MQTATAAPEFRKLPAVRQQTGLSTSTIYRLARAGEFPQPIKIGKRASAFDGTAVDAWIRDRIAEARKGGAK